MTSLQYENPLPQSSVALIERFAPLAPDYDVLFCDVWGVIHNGVAAFADACEALARFRVGRRHRDPAHQCAAACRRSRAHPRPARRSARGLRRHR